MAKNKELEALFNDPLLENIEKEDLTIFDVPENLKKSNKSQPDYVAKRVRCDNFEDYETGFKEVHEDLNSGKRQLVRLTKKQTLQVGSYYIISGMLMFIVHIDELQTKLRRKKKDARTRCVFENGTETDAYLDSLRKAITSDGYVVTESNDANEAYFTQSFEVNEKDIQDGWIYVLKSKSEKPEIKNQKNLYKVGFSTVPVERRIVNARNEPTYLMDNVEIVAVWKTFNMNTHVFENLIHSFLKAVQFKVRVKDENGDIYIAREWYVVPLGIMASVIEKIIDGSIIHYRYNPSLECLEKIEDHEETVAKRYDTTGMKILTLIIKQVWFDEIIAGRKTIEYRDLKQSTLNRYTWKSNEDGKRYLKVYDAIRFYVGYNKDRKSALVRIIDIKYDKNKRMIEYYLGEILE